MRNHYNRAGYDKNLGDLPRVAMANYTTAVSLKEFVETGRTFENDIHVNWNADDAFTQAIDRLRDVVGQRVEHHPDLTMLLSKERWNKDDRAQWEEIISNIVSDEVSKTSGLSQYRVVAESDVFILHNNLNVQMGDLIARMQQDSDLWDAVVGNTDMTEELDARLATMVAGYRDLSLLMDENDLNDSLTQVNVIYGELTRINDVLNADEEFMELFQRQQVYFSNPDSVTFTYEDSMRLEEIRQSVFNSGFFDEKYRDAVERSPNFVSQSTASLNDLSIDIAMGTVTFEFDCEQMSLVEGSVLQYIEGRFLPGQSPDGDYKEQANYFYVTGHVKEDLSSDEEFPHAYLVSAATGNVIEGTLDKNVYMRAKDVDYDFSAFVSGRPTIYLRDDGRQVGYGAMVDDPNTVQDRMDQIQVENYDSLKDRRFDYGRARPIDYSAM